jgi:hypothetical protein
VDLKFGKNSNFFYLRRNAATWGGGDVFLIELGMKGLIGLYVKDVAETGETKLLRVESARTNNPMMQLWVHFRI